MILVTGGTGLVGSHLLLHLLQKGETVRAIHRPGSDLQQVRKVFDCYQLQDHQQQSSNNAGSAGKDYHHLSYHNAGSFSENQQKQQQSSINAGSFGENQQKRSSTNPGPLDEDLPFGENNGKPAGTGKERTNSPASPNELFSRIEWFPADMLDPVSLAEAMEGVSKVYHCAAIISFDPSERKQTIKSNVDTTASIVDLCLEFGVEKLCHVSSVSAIGSRYDGQLVTEEDLWRHSKRRTGYSISKFYSEMEVWRGINEGLDAVIVNPSVILGPGNWHRGSGRFFAAVIRGMKYYTEGMTGFVDVRDVCQCMIELMESDINAERFILNGENIYYRDLFNMIADALGKPRPATYASKRLVEIGWRLEWLRSRLTFSKPNLTKETARSGRSISLFSNQKIKEATGHEFIPIKETISWTASSLPENI